MLTLIPVGFILIFFHVYFKIKFSYWEKKGIKGPKPLPFLGTIIAESALTPKELEEKFLKDYGKIFGTYFGTKPVLNVSDPELIKTILSDLKTFPNKESVHFRNNYLRHSMLFKNGSDWKSARSIQSHYFTTKKLRNLMDHFDIVTSNFLNNIIEIQTKTQSDDIEIKELAKCYALDIIAKALFAIDVDSYQERETIFVQSALDLGKINTIQCLFFVILPERISRFLKLSGLNAIPINNLIKYFEQMLKQRRQNDAFYNDLSDLLNEAVQESKITHNEALGNILLTFLAGIETVSNTITQMLFYLSEYPEVQNKLYKEIIKEFSDEISYEKLTQNEFLDACIQETLRLGNNLLILTRSTALDTKLGEIEIEKGTDIRLILYIVHTSNDHYSNPKEFRPDRFLRDSTTKKEHSVLFIPFSMGPKICIGQRLALLEVKYLLVRLLQKYEICKAIQSNCRLESFRGIEKTLKLNIGLKTRI